MAVDRVLRRLGVELLAVMEFDLGAQLDGEHLVVPRPFIRCGELRHDLEVGGDVEQLVAERGVDDAPDISSRQGGIEDVGILGETDPQRRLRAGTAGPGGNGAGQ